MQVQFDFDGNKSVSKSEQSWEDQDLDLLLVHRYKSWRLRTYEFYEPFSESRFFEYCFEV